MTSRRPSLIPAGADAPILTARLELQPVVEADAEALADVFLDGRMYRCTGDQPGTLDELRASFAHVHANRAKDRDGTAQHIASEAAQSGGRLAGGWRRGHHHRPYQP
jgi:hypothetical protein